MTHSLFLMTTYFQNKWKRNLVRIKGSEFGQESSISQGETTLFPYQYFRQVMKFCYLSCVMTESAFYIYENKGAVQLRDKIVQCTISPLPKSEMSNLYISKCYNLYSYNLYRYPSSAVVQSVFCPTWSETPKTGFLMTRLNFIAHATIKNASTQSHHSDLYKHELQQKSIFRPQIRSL